MDSIGDRATDPNNGQQRRWAVAQDGERAIKDPIRAVIGRQRERALWNNPIFETEEPSYRFLGVHNAE